MIDLLPTNWKKYTLSELTTFYNGNSISKKIKQEKYSGLKAGRNYIATKDIGFDGTVCYENGIKIPYKETQFKTAPPGCVFVCSEGGSAGKKTAYVTQEVCFGNKLYAIIDKQGLLNGKYLFYYTRYNQFYDQFKSLPASLMGGVNNKNFGNICIPVPPISEQQRIVNRIEEMFSQLDAGVETLKKTKAQLAVYRLAVLKEAFEGATVAGSNHDYRIMRIDSFANVDTGATPLKTNMAYYGGTIAWVASGKINEGAIYSPTDYITELALKETNCKVFPPGTILVAMYGEGKTRGKSAELMIPAATNQALAAITLNDDSPVEKKFLKWFLTYNYQIIRQKAAGGVQPNLNLGIIKSIKVKVFSKAVQSIIVQQIEERLSVCDTIEQTVDNTLQQAEAMRQSILKNAFEGRL